MNTILILILTLLLFNLLIYLKFETITNKLNFFDKPDGKLKKHSQPVSLIGGLIILINIYLIVFILNLLGLENLLFEKKYLFLFLFLTTLFYMIGALDDLKNINPNNKLLLVFIVLVISIFLFPEIKIVEIKISFLPKTYYFKFPYTQIFLILSFLLLVNAMNMFDGVNLQLISYCTFVIILFILKGFMPIFFILLTICLIMLGILNFRNKVFLGDGGSNLLSAVLGLTFIYQYKKFDNIFLGDEVFVILLIPAIDMLRLFFMRLINKSNPFKGDLNHLHHIVNRFIKDKTLTVIITVSICIAPTILMYLNIKTYIVLIGCSILYLILVNLLSRKKYL